MFPVTFVLPLIIGLLYKETWPFLLKSYLVPAVLTFGAGLAMTRYAGRADRPKDDMRPSESFVIVALLWLVIAFIGSLPYVLSGTISGPIDAYFESISGFTTTGASVLSKIDGISRSVLFWRSLTQWLGGMGIMVLMVAFFSRLLGGYKAGLMMFKGEVPGHSAERLVHRLRDTAKYLWLIYALLTLVGTLILTVLGMGLYDALCHTLTSLSTGGYSTHTESIAHFSSMGTYELIQSVLVLLMVAGSVNFILHYNALLKLRFGSYGRSPELRTYLSLILVAACVLAIVLALNRTYGPGRSLMGAIFTTVSIISTTGFATEDFSLWPMFAQFVVLLLMLSGGMTSSTTGGVKIARFMVAMGAVRRSLRRIGHPKAVSPIRIGGILIPENVIKMIGMFIFGYFLTFLIGSFLLTLTGLDALTAISASAASIGNVGPALGGLGPFSNYSVLNVPAKMILIALMWLGRLELITGFVLFLPSTYKN